ncbi:MAG: acetate--CoA ligase family protein [Syntrophobacteraceae bacterium]
MGVEVVTDGSDPREALKPAPAAYELLFTPRSIAVVGASLDPIKPGGRVIKAILEHDYRGKLWAVNPKTASILGLPTFPSIDALPSAPDLALIAIPALLVVKALRDLARKGGRAAIVLTSGFGEKDEEGKRREQEMLRIAHAAGMTLIGPNCSGFMTPCYKGKFAGLVPTLKGRSVDFISGSGATVDYVMEQATGRGLSFGSVVNLGNSIQMGVEDLLALYDEHYGPEHARILMLYMESVRKPGMLLRHARSLIRKGCMLVGIKSGVTEAGRRAAASHTGAMATDDTAVQALFEKAGIIRVRSKAELIDVACVLHAAGGALSGKRACIVTDAGGPGVMLSDELNRQGIELSVLSEKTRRRLREILPPESSVANPIDCLPSRTGRQIEAVLGVLAEEESGNIDVIVVITGDSGMSDNWEIYRAILSGMERSAIPVIPVLSSAVTSRQHIIRFGDAGSIHFPDEVQLGAALGKVAAWIRPDDSVPEMTDYDPAAIGAALTGRSGLLPPEAAFSLLRAAGYRLPKQSVVSRLDELSGACEAVGFPLVLKVIGPLHKSDVGGVRVGVRDVAEAQEAWLELMAIEGASGVLVQELVEGTEVILGASHAGDFGHLILFGLGGIHTEVMKDIRFALAPITRSESFRMIRSIRGLPILEGTRGGRRISLERLADYVTRLGRLVSDFPEIKELDLNPVKGGELELIVVDARIII